MISTIIIDDHSLFNDGLKLILKESNKFDVIEQIYDSRMAYHKCFSLRPDLVLVDYNMPYLNGLEIVKELKSLTYDMKIVIISMYADKREISQFKKLNVDGYLNKTDSSNNLIDSLSKIMSGQKLFVGVQMSKEMTMRDSFALKHHLTKRELEILRFIKLEYTTEQIADTLNLSYYTVETHRKNINQKLRFKTKKEFYKFLEELN